MVTTKGKHIKNLATNPKVNSTNKIEVFTIEINPYFQLLPPVVMYSHIPCSFNLVRLFYCGAPMVLA